MNFVKYLFFVCLLIFGNLVYGQNEKVFTIFSTGNVSGEKGDTALLN